MSTAVKKSAGRSWLSAIALILAIALTPAAIVTHWATSEVTNTQRFVSTLSPLANNPTVQETIITEVTTIIDKQVDIKEVTTSLFEGLGNALDLPDAAKKALGMLAAPAASGVEGLVQTLVSNVVKSQAFADAWDKTLTLTQEQTVALLSDSPDSVIKLSNDGTLTLPLKPIIVEIKAELVKQGVGFASAIPEVNTDITIGKVPELALARVLYQVGVGVGTWLPWVVAALFVVGIAAARRRPRALAATGSVMLGLMALMAFLFTSGRIVATTVIDPNYSPIVGAVYDALVAFVLNVVLALAVASVFAIITGWAFGVSESAEKFRAFSNKQITSLRKTVDPQDKILANSSVVMHKYRIVARVVIIGGIALILSSIIPLTVADVFGWTLTGLVLLFAYEVLQRPVVTAAAPKVAETVAAAAPAANTVAVKKAPAKKAPAKKAPAASAAKKPAAKKSATGSTKPVAKKPTTKKS
ncbi:hypothetical protein [Aurantimicrobium minutum]|uniref:hypothetical protein n=1 Tax=Aurantimicrobium minutum TaxID=708131 RepID=UPI002474B762|nr:hypothetical protein [Aurantimicrobium minutum]MDH6537206.1 hypothetical protein [Aurantimicrobium minutum]